MNTLLKIFLISLAISLSVSCQKITETPPKLGEQVSAKAINDELSKVDQEIDPFAAKIGDGLGMMMNVMIENPGNLQTLALYQRQVVGKAETDEGVKIKIRNTDYSVKEDTVTEVRNEVCTMTLNTRITYVCPSDEEAPEEEAQNAGLAESRKALLKSLSASQGKEESEKPIEKLYYGLKTAKETITPPEVIRNRENCSGLSPCQIRLHHVQFDEVLVYKNQPRRRIRWDYALTPDLVFLGTEGIQYQICASESIEYNQRPVLLKQCLFVYDLIKTPSE